VLAAEVSLTPSSSPKNKAKNKANLIPGLLIGVGGLLLLTPLILVKIKHEK
jgi:hypothetical protein